MKYKIIKQEKNASKKIDVTVEFEIDKTKHYTTFAFISQREIDHDLQNRVNRSVSNIKQQLLQKNNKQNWDRNELEALLREKGYLTNKETIENLKTKDSLIKEVKNND